MRRQDIQFTVLMGGVFCFLTVTRLAQTGMFLDGLTYAAVSRNLAQGIGTFWAPSYTSTLYPRFFEQPPLALGLQAVAFAIFGDHLLVERAYSVTLGCVTALLMMAIWRNTVGAPDRAWLPVLFWLLPATVTWSIVNNMLENTQAVFTTLAVLAFVRALRTGTSGYLWGSLGGLSIVAAVLAKGPVGLFPLAAPVVLAMVMPKRASEAARAGTVILGSLVIAFALVLMQSDARSGLWTYWQQAVVASVTGARERAPSRWVLALDLLEGIGLRMGGAVGLAWLYTRRRHGGRDSSNAWTWFFFGLALAGSLPIAISPKIMGVYLVPSIPLYALGFANLTRCLLERSRDSRPHERAGLPLAGLLGVALLMASIAVPLAWGPLEARDIEWVAEYRTLSASLPRGETLGTCEPARTNFGLHAYMQRLFQVSLDPDSTIPRRYFLQLTDVRCDPPPRCRPLAGSRRLALLECGD